MKINVSKRAKRVRIAVRPGGEVIATLPQGTNPSFLDRFIMSKAAWIARAVARMRKLKPPQVLPRTQYKARRKETAKFVKERIAVLNESYGFSYASITIRNQKSRWGSCSRQGNLSFNYRLAQLPRELADYVIVHELCHLKELNHSKRFWALVAQTVPSPKEVRKELRRYSLRVG